MASMTDLMTDLGQALDAERLVDALAAVNALWRARRGERFTDYTLADFGNPSTLGDLFARYDYGEPEWNGTLCLLARALEGEAQPRTVAATENLPGVERDGIERFHHGDVHVAGDLGVYESTWITGDLTVDGVIDASYLDAFADLFVGGRLRCRAVRFMGLSLVGGRLEASELVAVDAQGSNWFLGGVESPLLLGESESTRDEDDRRVGRHVDLDDFDDDLPALAALLGIEVADDDTFPCDLLFRAFEGLRTEVDAPPE